MEKTSYMKAHHFQSIESNIVNTYNSHEINRVASLVSRTFMVEVVVVS